MGKYTKMSQQVLEKVGGLSNITFVERCATRLRIHYASKSKVDVEKRSRALKMSWAW